MYQFEVMTSNRELKYKFIVPKTMLVHFKDFGTPSSQCTSCKDQDDGHFAPMLKPGMLHPPIVKTCNALSLILKEEEIPFCPNPQHMLIQKEQFPNKILPHNIVDAMRVNLTNV
jgi:hypothetical protein